MEDPIEDIVENTSAEQKKEKKKKKKHRAGHHGGQKHRHHHDDDGYTVPHDKRQKEAEAVTEFRSLLAKENHEARHKNDDYLLRFLRARKYDVRRALSILNHYEKWNRDNNISKLHIGLVAKQLETGTITFPESKDLEGRAVLYMIPGKYYPSETPTSRLMRSVVYLLERAIDKTRTQIEGFTFIANMNGWGWSNFSVGYAKTFFDTLQSRFPARIRAFLIVDPPGWFGMIWRLIRPMMSAKFASKVHLIPRSKLTEYLALDQIPQDLDGESTFDISTWIGERFKIEGLNPDEWQDLDPVDAPALTADALSREDDHGGDAEQK